MTPFTSCRSMNHSDLSMELLHQSKASVPRVLFKSLASLFQPYQFLQQLFRDSRLVAQGGTRFPLIKIDFIISISSL